ncbi:MAG: pantoate--beta-alanine ligase [Candidatus Omnitrophota bacterium]
MKVIRNPQKLNRILKRISCERKSIGFVPTMGALHLGHLSLIKKAAEDNEIVVVSIFVNPTQFGPKEDLKKYPRPLKKDIELCRRSGVDFVFLPDNKTIYPYGYSTFVKVEGLSDLLCGVSRPGHFRGVSTIVAKLLNIVGPDIIYLGQKDAQQAIIIKRMVRDLNFPVKVKIMPTVRLADGLAISSRNAYLTREQKNEAAVLSRSLSLARSLVRAGARDNSRILGRMKRLIGKKKQARIDYIEIVDLENLEKIKKIDRNCLIALAVKFGNTRLIDNTIINYA